MFVPDESDKSEDQNFLIASWSRAPRDVRFVIVAVAVALLLGVASGFIDDSPTTSTPRATPAKSSPSTGSCSPLTAAPLNQLTSSWTGNGALTVLDHAKAPSDGSGIFSEVWFLKGSAPGVTSQVYVWAHEPGGLLVGGDAVTREFFDWGSAAQSGSTADLEARAAVRAAPRCLR